MNAERQEMDIMNDQMLQDIEWNMERRDIDRESVQLHGRALLIAYRKDMAALKKAREEAEAELAAIREECPCVRMQSHFSDTAFQAVQYTVNRLIDAEADKAKLIKESEKIIDWYDNADNLTLSETDRIFQQFRDLVVQIKRKEKADAPA